jgi:hypothetical protein
MGQNFGTQSTKTQMISFGSGTYQLYSYFWEFKYEIVGKISFQSKIYNSKECVIIIKYKSNSQASNLDRFACKLFDMLMEQMQLSAR